MLLADLETYVLHVDARAVIHQDPHHVDVASSGGQMQSAIAGRRSRPQLIGRLLRQEFPAHRLIAGLHRQQKGYLPFLRTRGKKGCINVISIIGAEGGGTFRYCIFIIIIIFLNLFFKPLCDSLFRKEIYL